VREFAVVAPLSDEKQHTRCKNYNISELVYIIGVQRAAPFRAKQWNIKWYMDVFNDGLFKGFVGTPFFRQAAYHVLGRTEGKRGVDADQGHTAAI